MRQARGPLLALIAALLAPSTACEAAPQGELIKFTYADSKIFPGTTRDVIVYVPKQYDGSKPACVHVNQDGVQFKGPEVFDDLIEKKEIPVLIGVFVRPGEVKPVAERAMSRTNRSFEYDSLGDAYARFLLDELLPEVERKTTTDGRAIKLSKDGNDRSIGGSSSGAIAAFTAAWERPDAFSRVFSSIGTYVGLRGGEVYPTLIRKVEPKALRVFLQDGSGDLNNFGGDWWMANQTMERAFKFAGYEVEHVWGDGGHNGTQATQVYPDALRFLWKAYPEPVKAGAGSQQMKELVVPGEGWRLVGEGYKFTEGPTANAKGEVFFSDIPEGKTYKIGPDGTPAPFIADSQNANGLAFGPDGKLYACATKAGGGEQVLTYNAEGSDRKVLADGIRGNDVVVRHDGGAYVTNPNVAGPDRSRVWYISPQGEKKVVDTGINFTNGVALSPDQSLLYVTDFRSRWVYSYQIQPDGSLAHKQKYFHLHVLDTADDAAPDGIRVDREGRLYVATRSGVQVCDREGRVSAILPTPNGKASNLCFGGPELDTLYVTAGEKVFKRKVNVRGVNAFDPPVKPTARN